jgi:hypothetical protein
MSSAGHATLIVISPRHRNQNASSASCAEEVGRGHHERVALWSSVSHQEENVFASSLLPSRGGGKTCTGRNGCKAQPLLEPPVSACKKKTQNARRSHHENLVRACACTHSNPAKAFRPSAALGVVENNCSVIMRPTSLVHRPRNLHPSNTRRTFGPSSIWAPNAVDEPPYLRDRSCAVPGAMSERNGGRKRNAIPDEPLCPRGADSRSRSG